MRYGVAAILALLMCLVLGGMVYTVWRLDHVDKAAQRQQNWKTLRQIRRAHEQRHR